MFTFDVVKRYANFQLSEESRTALPPHIFAIGEESYRNLQSFQTNQVILIR